MRVDKAEGQLFRRCYYEPQRETAA